VCVCVCVPLPFYRARRQLFKSSIFYTCAHAHLCYTPKAAFLLEDPRAEELFARSQNWTLLLNPNSGFLAARYIDGSFKDELFDEFLWGNTPGYTESGPWQYRLEVPYDPSSLQTALANMGIDAAELIEQVFSSARRER
jgi:putative alpha-1,2-mannosidase